MASPFLPALLPAEEGASGAGFGGGAADDEAPAPGAKEDRVKDRSELRREALEKASAHTQGGGAGGKAVCTGQG